MNNTDIIEKITDKIRGSKNFIVTSHTSPDGDNIGSSIAMTLFLRKLEKKAWHVLDDSVPENLRFLLDEPGRRAMDESDMRGRCHRIYTSEEFLATETGRALAQSGDYVLIILDTADESRICVSSEIWENASFTINIDHHVSNRGYADFNHIEPEASSTCEVLCSILRSIDEKKFTPQIATAVYTGISTDTDNFLYDSVDAHTFENASFLTKMGADRDTVANRIYQSTSYDYLRLTKESLDTLEVDDSVGIMILTMDMLERNNVDYKDTDSLVNNVININGVRVAILIKERGRGEYKISLRSKDATNVCEIAARFGGGGHKRAAGCSMNGDLDTVVSQIKEAAKEQICITDL